MTDSLESQLQAVRGRLAELEVSMLELQSQFLAEIKGFLRDWFWSKAEEVAKSKPEVIKSIGPVRLTEFKDEVRMLQGKAGELVDRQLPSDKLWCQMAGSGSGWFISSESPRLPDFVNVAIRRAAGGLASPLESFGFLAAPERNDLWAWRERDSGGIHRYPAGVYYPGQWVIPSHIIEIMQEYERKIRSLSTEEMSESRIKREIVQRDAANLWDST